MTDALLTIRLSPVKGSSRTVKEGRCIVHEITGFIPDPFSKEMVSRTISGCLILSSLLGVLNAGKSTSRVGSLAYILNQHAIDVEKSRSLTDPCDTGVRKRKVIVLSKGTFDDALRHDLLNFGYHVEINHARSLLLRPKSFQQIDRSLSHSCKFRQGRKHQIQSHSSQIQNELVQ